MTGKQEYDFKYGLSKRLRNLGYLVVWTGRTQLVDLVAAKQGSVYFLELKGRDTEHPEEQKARQVAASRQFHLLYAVVRQGQKRGRLEVEMYDRGRLIHWDTTMLGDDLSKWVR